MGDTADMMRAELDEIARVLDGTPTSIARAGLADQVRVVVEALEEARAEILALRGLDGGGLPGWRFVGYRKNWAMWERREGRVHLVAWAAMEWWVTDFRAGARPSLSTNNRPATSLRGAMLAADEHVSARSDLPRLEAR
jgi:hypothetical protein